MFDVSSSWTVRLFLLLSCLGYFSGLGPAASRTAMCEMMAAILSYNLAIDRSKQLEIVAFHV